MKRMFPRHLIALARVKNINLIGRGGREKDISILLPKWKRVNAPLYDYEREDNNIIYKLEVKKQQNLQWFDIGKYYRLSNTNQNIYVMFLNHNKGKITDIFIICLGDLIDWLCKNRKIDGWSDKVIKKAAEFKRLYPSLQFKVRVYIKTIFYENPELFEIIYQG